MSNKLKVTNPYDGSLLEEVPTQTSVDVEAALASASNLFVARDEWLPLVERIDILLRTQELMRAAESDLARLIALEGGKPLRDAEVEVARAIDGVGLCVEHIRAHIGERVPLGTNAMTAGRWAMTVKEPIGVVVAVSAFNHPLNLIIHQVAPAIAAGCPVIVKPSADTPLCCLRFVELLVDAGLPKTWCQTIVTEDNAVAEALVTDQRIGFFSFIGSARVGWMLRAKLAPGVRCALEHGGAAPVIVCADANIADMVSAVVKGAFYHAGQVCVSVQRLFVPTVLREQIVERLCVAVAQLVVGDPTDPKTDVGPLIRPAEVERVDQWVSAARGAGTECRLGGSALSEHLYAPTILINPPADQNVSSREIFGPVLCVYDYDDENEAVARSNGLDVAFQAAVFTETIDTAIRLGQNMAASAVMVNDHTAFRDDVMPFAGLRTSGLGVGGIPHTIEDMQIDKMIVFKSREIRT